MDQTKATEIFNKQRQGTATEAELELLELWLLQYRQDQQSGLTKAEFEASTSKMWLYINSTKQPLVKVMPLWKKFMGIAAAVATIVFGVWFFSPSRHGDNGRHPELVSGSDIAPGKNGATITLSTGEVIQLSDSKKGVIIDPTSLTYDDGSEIASKAAQPRNDGRGGSLKTGTIVQMTASTTKGQTYEFTLPDGSHVFLNADSRIIFPSQFSGKERKILLEGEAYFVVKHDEKQPFRVESKGQVVEDIGTEFNINAYADESNVKTTLVEGSAKVSAQPTLNSFQRHPELVSGSRGGKSAMQVRGSDLRQDDGSFKQDDKRFKQGVTLSPNQQSTLTGGQLKVKAVDVESVIDWKNNLFVFENEQLSSIMSRIKRWYGIEVIYEDGQVGALPFSGSVSRFKNLSTLLRQLENAGQVKFKIAERKVMVMKK